MNDSTYIVVRDLDPYDRPDSLPFREGDVLDEARAAQWGPTGVLLLPVHAPSLPQRGAIGSIASTAYQRHVYGSDGVRFDGARFQRGCSVPICLPSGSARVEWMAQLSFDGDEIALLRLAAEETAHGILRVTEIMPGPTDAVLRLTGPLLADGILRGSATVSGMDRCFGAVCLAGACVGVRVLWLAVTVLPR